MINLFLVEGSFAQQYNFKSYDLEQDLDIEAQGSIVHHLLSTNKGYLIIGGNESLYFFDGKSAEPLVQELELPFSSFENIQEKPSGEIYFLNNGNLQFIKNEKLHEVPLNVYVNCFEFQGDYILLGTNKGLQRYDERLNIIDVPESLMKLNKLKIQDLIFSNNNLVIATEAGFWIYNLENSELEEYTKSNSYDILSMTLDRENRIWSFDNKGTIIMLDWASQNLLTFNNPGFNFTTLTCDHQNRMWFGTSNKGILRYDQTADKWSAIDQQRGLTDNRVLDLETDAWGSVWLTTADHILSKFIDKDYELYNVYNGLASDEIHALHSNDNRILFSAGTKGVFEYAENQFSSVSNSEAIINTKCTSIHADSNDIWIGTNGKGLVKINENEYTVFRKESGLPSDWITQLSSDTMGNLWIGSPSNGLARLSKIDSSIIKIDAFGTEEGLSDLHITALHTKENGPTYYGTIQGKAGVISGNNHLNISFQNDEVSEISDIAEDRDGNIYLATMGNGLFVYRNEKKATASPLEYENLAIPLEIKGILLRDEILWLVNDKGIYTIDLQNESPQLNKFLVSDGFPSNNITKGTLTSFKNKTWTASMDGLIKIGALNSTSISKIPMLHFEEILVDFVPLAMLPKQSSQSFHVKHNQNISFNFKGVDINSSKDLTYSYLLEGRDKVWSPWTKSNNQSYNSLVPGMYAFKVRAKSFEENISEAITYSFEVRGPIWKQWWFIIAAVLGLISLLWLFFRSRLRIVKRRNTEEKAKLELKNRLLELEQKANQLQMNPHFIFNALNSIQSTVAKEDYKDARKEINDFALLMRSILSNSKERVITLQDEINLLEKYIQIEKTCRALDFSYQIEVDSKIDADELMIPPMLIQPFVENAIVHGLNKKIGGELLLKISLLNEYVLECLIIDNGTGFENTKKTNNHKKHKSVAIQVTRERLENMLDKKYLPAVNIRQIDAEIGGTEVILKIPVEYNF